jgi:uncharacterized membrane protein
MEAKPKVTWKELRDAVKSYSDEILSKIKDEEERRALALELDVVLRDMGQKVSEEEKIRAILERTSDLVGKLLGSVEFEVSKEEWEKLRKKHDYIQKKISDMFYEQFWTTVEVKE